MSLAIPQIAPQQEVAEPKVTRKRRSAIVPINATPLDLLRIAVSQNADLEKLSKLMDLQERWERNEARKAFVASMNAFKAEPSKILKTKQVGFDHKTGGGRTEYKYAPLDQVCEVVIAGLSKHGISHRWTMNQDKEWIRVTCVLTHELGHSEETTLVGCADQSGQKNPIQAVGSTVTYLQRYTLLAATGLAAADTDNDGRGTSASSLPMERVNAFSTSLANAATLDALREVFKTAYSEAAAASDRNAQAAYIRVKDARKKELQ